MVEEKTTKLNNIMNKKVNMDFFKNMMSPIKISKLKSRKIFNTKAPVKPDNNAQLAPPIPERTCVDRSPVRISRISSLVEGAPEYDYSFGHISISDSHIELNSTKQTDQKDQSPAKPMRFSEKLSKQYKELSEFKFKHILGKKTVVRTTSIEVENYSHRPEDLISERSDFDFEFHSLPAGTGGSFEYDPESTPESAVSKRLRGEKIERTSTIRSSGSLQTVSNIEPNESSLWKHMNTLTRKNTVQRSGGDNSGEEQTEKSEKNSGVSKMSFNKQNFEEACNRAKTTVTNKLQKLKSFQERIMDPKSASTPGNEDSKTKNRSDPDSMVRKGSSKTEAPVYGRNKFSMKRTLGRPQPNAWRGEPVAQTSIDSDGYSGSRCLRSEDSVDSDDRSVVTIRPAPPIPTCRKVAPGLPSDIRKISIPRPARPITPDETSWRGHLRKPSSESVDSDSWIPELFKGPARNQINLDIIEEKSSAWTMSKPLKRHEFRKSTSIDIFNRKGDEAFEDFDDALRNVPAVPIRNDPKPKLDKPKPLVVQTAIAKEIEPIPDEERSFHFNKLISRFEDSSKSTNGSSNGSLDSYPEQMTSFESKIIVHRGNVKEYDDDDVASMQTMPQQWHFRNANENGAVKYSMHGKAPHLKDFCRTDELVSSVEDDIDGDVFHSLDYNDYNPTIDPKCRYRLNSVKIVYSVDV